VFPKYDLPGLFFSWVASPQRISVPDYSYLECPITFSKSIECQMITQSSILSSQVKTRMMCLSLPLNQGGPIPQGNVLIPIQGMYLSSFLGITKFLPSKKLTIRLPLNQGPPAAMVRHPAAHEEFLSSMSWISILRNLQLLAS